MKHFLHTIVLIFTIASSVGACENCIAKHKSSLQASRGYMHHVGGSFGRGRYEGVGMSTRSAADAIQHCCYWGQRTPIGIGTAYRNGAWYATVIYQ